MFFDKAFHVSRGVNAIVGGSLAGIFAAVTADPHIVMAIGVIAGVAGSVLTDVIRSAGAMAVSWFNAKKRHLDEEK